jgi:hypothetical protein
MTSTDIAVLEPAVERVADPGGHRAGLRMGPSLMIGLAVSGWIGFLVLAGILVAGRTANTPPREVLQTETRAGSVATTAQEVPVPHPVFILTTFEERRRVQERVQEWDVADHQNGNVAAARNVYEHAVRKGWAPAALALALAYDPHELQRRGVTVAPDADRARGCYIKARELMNVTVSYYLSRLPPGRGDRC